MSQKQWQGNARNLLAESVKKHMSTLMIGSIARIEEHFGYLWGHNKIPERRTQKEKEFKESWSKLRKDILDLGNDKICDVIAELTLYTIDKRKFHYEFRLEERESDD